MLWMVLKMSLNLPIRIRLSGEYGKVSFSCRQDKSILLPD